MRYTIYVDIIFFWLFIINYLTYYLTCKISKNHISKVLLLVWSLLTSIINTYICVTLMYENKLIFNTLYSLSNLIMFYLFVRYGLRKKWGHDFLNLATINLLLTFFVAGILYVFVKDIFVLKDTLPLVLSLLFIIPSIFKNIYVYYKSKGNSHQIIIETNQSKIKTVGYMDTGNSLMDIHSGNPVIIISPEIIQDLIKIKDYPSFKKYINTGQYMYIKELNIDGERIYPIPYNTINNNSSIMPAFKIKQLTVNNEFIYHNVVAGISRYNFCKKECYKVLLNINL